MVDSFIAELLICLFSFSVVSVMYSWSYQQIVYHPCKASHLPLAISVIFYPMTDEILYSPELLGRPFTLQDQQP
jgi:hypothetical protein